MEIFQADIKDIPKIMEVAEATWRQTYYGILSADQVDYMYAHIYTPGSLSEQMKTGVTFLIAREDENILGFAAYEYRQEEPDSPEGRTLRVIFVPKIYIKPEAQRKGTGKKLLMEIERIGGSNNCHFVELNVNRNNPALHFYEKLGFFVHQSVDIPIGPYWMNDFVMRKSIQFVAP